ncbi:hypothetical protein B0H14DRAFT_2702486 [Mycena olivaceomarginata]|nr:hypothetical protein B0H14DRAFT_2702486 [Mycena olivaceomarginata]
MHLAVFFFISSLSPAPRVSHRVRASHTRTAMRTRALPYSAHTSGTARHLTRTLWSENAWCRVKRVACIATTLC